MTTDMQQLEAGHGALKAVRIGQGRDLVLLHSLFADRRMFDAVVPALAANFRLTLVDLPGFGGSERAMLPLLDAYVARLEDGFEEFGIQPDAIVLGNGFGGLLALAFGLQHPERLSGVIACAAAAAVPDEAKQQLQQVSDQVALRGLAALADDLVQAAFAETYLSPERRLEHRQALAAVDGKAFCDACKVMIDTDLSPLLVKFDRRLLVVTGAEDRLTPPALGSAIVDKVSGARFVELPGSGHCPPLEQPEAFLAATADFLRG